MSVRVGRKTVSMSARLNNVSVYLSVCLYLELCKCLFVCMYVCMYASQSIYVIISDGYGQPKLTPSQISKIPVPVAFTPYKHKHRSTIQMDLSQTSRIPVSVALSPVSPSKDPSQSKAMACNQIWLFADFLESGANRVESRFDPLGSL